MNVYKMTVNKEKAVLFRTKSDSVITKRRCVSSLLMQTSVDGPPILVRSLHFRLHRYD